VVSNDRTGSDKVLLATDNRPLTTDLKKPMPPTYRDPPAHHRVTGLHVTEIRHPSHKSSPWSRAEWV